jgi:hypothetical protein
MSGAARGWCSFFVMSVFFDFIFGSKDFSCPAHCLLCEEPGLVLEPPDQKARVFLVLVALSC